ncbi:MAG: PRC-barrel domain-containing protein [Candidatus Bathyarchaeia archaeon]|nr:PRC-barrel domain-containing protein [Candidatus Bathyarchaeota archaeon]
MSKKNEKTSISSKEFEGKQVIDANGTLIGSVKELIISIPDGVVSLLVSMRDGNESKIEWSSIKSIGDVVLLNKEIELQKPSAPTLRPIPTPPPPPLTIECSNCKSKIPAKAKFCPRCGFQVKQE